ncbi:MAG: stage V sporulation protein AD [Ruminococcaceae bacterium]|nr:stage V sporulation protein AD [Oscillospiraceae bacterium]
MQKITYLENPVYIESFAAVGGLEESRGPLGGSFDLIDKKDLFGMKTWERAEGEMGRLALNIALKKLSVSPDELNVLVAGDLQNQCVASSGGLFSFGIPFLGLYGACSTCTEGLLILASMLTSSKTYTRGACVTSSHNCAAERQFRTPIEYGGQRTPTAQWTATAAGAFVLSKSPSDIAISAFMPGKIIDGYTKDQSNMGAAMALSAFDTVSSFFSENDPEDYDLILTGDLGEVGSRILRDMLCEKGGAPGKKLASIHNDCGLMLYDRSFQDAHSGASGCGCSASVMASHILPLVRRGEIRRMLLLSTGALMSTSSVCQGENILGVAPLIRIEHMPRG